jgi:hypothetical protein
MIVGDFGDNLVEAFHVADVDPAVGERGAEFVLGALGDAVEVWGGLFETVECVDCDVLVC